MEGRRGEQVRINGVAVFAYAQDGLLRVSLDDWERLGLVPGQQVVIGDQRQLLMGTEDQPPFVWLRLRCLSRKVG